MKKDAGLSAGYIARCINGKKKLSIDAVVNISNILGVSITEIIEGNHKVDFIKLKIANAEKSLEDLKDELRREQDEGE